MMILATFFFPEMTRGGGGEEGVRKGRLLLTRGWKFFMGLCLWLFPSVDCLYWLGLRPLFLGGGVEIKLLLLSCFSFVARVFLQQFNAIKAYFKYSKLYQR